MQDIFHCEDTYSPRLKSPSCVRRSSERPSKVPWEESRYTFFYLPLLLRLGGYNVMYHHSSGNSFSRLLLNNIHFQQVHLEKALLLAAKNSSSNLSKGNLR